MTIKRLMKSIATLQIKDIIFRSYVVMNGLMLHFYEAQLPFPFDKRYESCQTKSGITKVLIRNGFKNITITRNRHFIVTAAK